MSVLVEVWDDETPRTLPIVAFRSVETDARLSTAESLKPRPFRDQAEDARDFPWQLPGR
ncbi:MAG: hypothetical protein ACKOEO_27225 [Planctomycetaceae bacterium]